MMQVLNMKLVKFVMLLVVGTMGLWLTACSSTDKVPLYEDGDIAPVDGDTDFGEMEHEIELDADPSDGDMDVVETEEEAIDVFKDGCNGHASLCDRPFDQVAFATTHNAMSNRDDSWAGPNQNHGIPQQLEDGIRAMMIDSYEHEGEAYLCHGDCLFGKIEMVTALQSITEFLNSHPAEVFTLIFEDYLGYEKTKTAFEASGLLDFIYVPDPETGWPTLREMIEANTRVVVLSDSGASEDGWYLPLFGYCFETHYSYQTPEDFSCNSNRGSENNDLFILNHFLTNPLPSEAFAEQVNYNPLFIERATACGDHYSRPINFVTVDFYDIGDVLSVVDTLNGLGE